MRAGRGARRRRAFGGATLLAALLMAPVKLPAHHAEFRPLRPGTFASLVSARQGKPFLLVLWSVACEPCRDQLALLRRLRADYPQMPLVLVCTDGLALQQAAGKVMLEYGLEHESLWIFSSRSNPSLRREIDPDWDGGLPRAYLYDASHARQAAGVLSRGQIEDWLAGGADPP